MKTGQMTLDQSKTVLTVRTNSEPDFGMRARLRHKRVGFLEMAKK